jgi:hypothetical protein
MSTNHITELQCDPGSQNEFAIAYTWAIDSYTIGDWNGAVGNLVQFFSDTPGTPAIIDLVAIGNVYVTYVSFQDISFINGTVYASSTCTNVSDNSGIVWSISDTPWILVGGEWRTVINAYKTQSGAWLQPQSCNVTVQQTWQ